MKRLSAIVVATVMLLSLGLIIVFSARGEKDFRKKYEGSDLDHISSVSDREHPYSAYKAMHAKAAIPKKTISIDLSQWDKQTSFGVNLAQDASWPFQAVDTAEESSVFWDVLNRRRRSLFY